MEPINHGASAFLYMHPVGWHHAPATNEDNAGAAAAAEASSVPAYLPAGLRNAKYYYYHTVWYNANGGMRHAAGSPFHAVPLL